MNVLFQVFHLVLCLGVLGYAGWSLSRRVTLLNVFVTLFITFCFVGVHFFDIFPDLLPSHGYSDVGFRRMLTANMIFCGVALVALLLERPLLEHSPENLQHGIAQSVQT